MRKTPFSLILAAAVAFARMNVDDVLRLVKAGVSETIILEQIERQHQTFDLTPDQLIQLKQGHVNDRVIRAMMAGTAVTGKAAAEAPSSGARPRRARTMDAT